MEDKYLSTSEASEMLGVSVRRVVGLCNENAFEGAVRQGRSWKIPRNDIFDYLANTDADRFEKIIAGSGTKALLPFAIGSASYEEVVSTSYYVDKTLLIKELIDDHNKVVLFTRPRRFGKTLTVSMLKTFFEISEEDTSKYFFGRKIWGCDEKYRAIQGTYPVIMLTFKDMKYETWEESMDAIRKIMKAEYRRHTELYSSTVLTDSDKDYLTRMQQDALSDVEYSRSLLDLVRMLAEHHKKKVVILIDEYDTPIQQGYSKGYYEKMISFMRIFLSGGLKDNHDLAFGVLTGIMRISKENLFSGLNNLTVNTVLDEKYSSYFGFTEDEVLEMAKYYGLTDRMEELRNWYDGYRFGSTEIYNPWSVTNYFNSEGQAKAFWANTSSNDIIIEIMQGLTPEVAENLSSVMQGEVIHTPLNMEVVYPRMTDGSDTIFSFLLLAGYLTPVSTPEETEFGTFAALRLPNTEIKRVYNTEILDWMRTQSTGTVIPEIEKAIYLGDGNRLQKALEKYMITCISSFDGAMEGFYHGMVLGLVASLSSRYWIRSNREAGEGRFDLQLEPKTKEFPGIIMEFKAVPVSESAYLTALAEEAVSQIDSKQYRRELEDKGIRKIIRYGIAFSGKHVEIKTETD